MAQPAAADQAGPSEPAAHLRPWGTTTLNDMTVDTHPSLPTVLLRRHKNTGPQHDPFQSPACQHRDQGPCTRVTGQLRMAILAALSTHLWPSRRISDGPSHLAFTMAPKELQGRRALRANCLYLCMDRQRASRKGGRKVKKRPREEEEPEQQAASPASSSNTAAKKMKLAVGGQQYECGLTVSQGYWQIRFGHVLKVGESVAEVAGLPTEKPKEYAKTGGISNTGGGGRWGDGTVSQLTDITRKRYGGKQITDGVETEIVGSRERDRAQVQGYWDAMEGTDVDAKLEQAYKPTCRVPCMGNDSERATPLFEPLHKLVKLLAHGPPADPEAQALHACNHSLCISPMHVYYGDGVQNKKDWRATKKKAMPWLQTHPDEVPGAPVRFDDFMATGQGQQWMEKNSNVAWNEDRHIERVQRTRVKAKPPPLQLP